MYNIVHFDLWKAFNICVNIGSGRVDIFGPLFHEVQGEGGVHMARQHWVRMMPIPKSVTGDSRKNRFKFERLLFELIPLWNNFKNYFISIVFYESYVMSENACMICMICLAINETEVELPTFFFIK